MSYRGHTEKKLDENNTVRRTVTSRTTSFDDVYNLLWTCCRPSITCKFVAQLLLRVHRVVQQIQSKWNLGLTHRVLVLL